MPILGPTELLIVAIPWFFAGWPLGIAAVYIAWRKGRALYKWIVYGILLPPVALVHAAFAQTNHQAVERRLLAGGYHSVCPHCAEIIKKKATVCPHCGRDRGPR